MNLKYALAGFSIAGVTTPALADYWVIQDPTASLRSRRLTAILAMKHAGSTIVAMRGKIGTLAALTEGAAMGGL